MLFWICVVTLIIGIILCIIECVRDRYSQSLDIAAAFFTVIGAVAIIVSLIIMSMNYIGVDGYVAETNKRYEMLVYQHENNFYDNDLGKRELMVDIQDWNEGLAWYKENQQDFWIGIYIPNIYNQFEFVELK